MDVRLIDLPWLAKPPEDFRQQARSLAASSAESKKLARRLCGYRLDTNQLHALGKHVGRLATQDPGALRLGVLSNGTADLLIPALTVSSLRHGVWVHAIGTAFDQVAAEALNPASDINQARCHYVLLAVDHRGLPFVRTPGNSAGARASVDAALSYIESICCGLRQASACTVIVQTVPQVAGTWFGNLERNVPGTLQWLIDQFNYELRKRLEGSADLLLDAASLAESVGITQWHDPIQWALGKFSFSQELVPLYADHVGRLLCAARGRARKCLVLDLDNTLWGGVVGDDGLEGIVLGNGSPVGEAYLQVQHTALALRERGIVLAVSSKNDDHVARSPFQSHPEMLLKEQHIAVFQANWRDKAANLKAIAETLNFGLDALVLLDDNPAERAQVRDALLDVAVPELPTDPVFYAETLLMAGYFEAVTFTAEDKRRAEQYQSNAARAELLDAATDLRSYLRSLQMKAVCGPFDRVGASRITQLINKSNQFNLTTRRYTEAEVEAFEKSPSMHTLQMRLTDRFGDNGMIAVVICRQAGADWRIDTWLMSCRVLNRQVERATLNYIVSQAAARGVHSLIGQYIKTERNGLVKDHYSRLGFTPILEEDAGSLWRLDVATYEPVSVPIEIIETVPAQVAAVIP